MKVPTLALCIPAYNAAKYLPLLLSSALAQTVPFDEILVFDDCSSDDTGSVAAKYGARVIRSDRNVGCSVGKNRLLEICKCDWIHFHDSDDDLKPEFSKTAREWMIRVDAPDVVLFSYENRRFDTGDLVFIRKFDDEALVRDPAAYAIRNQINPYCGLYRRDSLRKVGGYDEDPEVLYNEDCRFHMRLAFNGLRFRADPRVEVINLERSGSMSSANRTKCMLARLAVLKKAALETPERLHREIATEAWINARHLASNQLNQEAAEAIALARRFGVSSPPDERLPVRAVAMLAPQFTFRARAAFVRWRDAR